MGILLSVFGCKLPESYFCDGHRELLNLGSPQCCAGAVASFPAERESSDTVKQTAESGRSFILCADAAQEAEPEGQGDGVAQSLVSGRISFLVLLALSMAMLLLFILSPSVAGRRTGFFAGIVLILMAVGALSFSFHQKNDYMKADSAIIMRPVSAVKSSPSSESSQDLFVLHEGTKVKVIDNVGSWNNIELADGRQGWIPSADLELI